MIQLHRPQAARRWTRASDYRAPARPWLKRVTPVVVMLPLAALTAVFVWDGPPPALAFGAPVASAADRDAASFTICGHGARVDCVVDGDTFWFRGTKIRIADINTPEVSEPQCMAEARLGQQATERLHALLNAGPFSLEPVDRDTDRYGRLLRVVTRGGESLGLVLVREGLAEEWRGVRGTWC